MTYVQFPSNYPIWPSWSSIAWENLFFLFEQKMLLFAVIIWRGDRKQILIMLWTHRGKKTYLWVTAKWVSIAKLRNTVALCVHFLFPGTRLVLWLEVGLGRWMTSPVVLTFESWHSGTLCSYSPPTSPPSPLWSPDCAQLCLFFPPSKNTSFSLPPLKQLLAYEVEKMTLHLMMNGTWPLEPIPVGLTWRCHLHKPGDRTNELVYIQEKQATWTFATAKVPQMKIKYLLINLGCKLDNLYRCFASRSSCFLVWHTSVLEGLPHWELFCYMINYSEQQLWRD